MFVFNSCIARVVAPQPNTNGGMDALLYVGTGFDEHNIPYDPVQVICWLDFTILTVLEGMESGESFEIQNARVTVHMNTFGNKTIRQVKVSKGVGIARILYPVELTAVDEVEHHVEGGPPVGADRDAGTAGGDES